MVQPPMSHLGGHVPTPAPIRTFVTDELTINKSPCAVQADDDGGLSVYVPHNASHDDQLKSAFLAGVMATRRGLSVDDSDD